MACAAQHCCPPGQGPVASPVAASEQAKGRLCLSTLPRRKRCLGLPGGAWSRRWGSFEGFLASGKVTSEEKGHGVLFN